MQTCVVAIVGLDSTDNFRHLPHCFYETVDKNEIRFILHNDPQEEYRSHRVERNYDLLLDLGHLTTFPHANFVSRRLTKMAQAVELNKIVERLEINNFVKIPVLNKRPNPRNMFDMSNLPDLVLIKSTDGARGVGHVIFDTTKASVFKFIRDVKEIGYSPSGGNGFQKVMEEYNEAIEIHCGQHHGESEIVDVLSTHDLMLTPVIGDIIAEVRVVTGAYGKPALVKKRERVDTVLAGMEKGTGYRQATGANRDNTTAFTTIDSAAPACHRTKVVDIERVLQELPPLNSVDLFFTQTGWGIFEYCNQFGTEAFEIEDLVELHTGMLTRLFKEHITG